MSTPSFGAILKAALIAGIIAGLTVAVFHLVVTEPVIDRAIELEEQHASAHGEAHEEPIVSRRTQKGGLVLGYLLYGLTWALPFAVVYQLVQRRLPADSRTRQALILAFLAYWSICLLPFLKYPANPPGVGDPETIGTRQTLFVGFLALSLASVVVSVWIGRVLARAQGWEGRAWLPTAACLAVLSVTLYLVMPDTTDEVAMPADLVRNFRLLSLLGLTLFWAVLGFLFGKLLGNSPVVAA
jgi:predicted cobalt transporter CbtA